MYGPGLKGGIVNHESLFVVETNKETGALGELNIWILMEYDFKILWKVIKFLIGILNKFTL